MAQKNRKSSYYKFKVDTIEDIINKQTNTSQDKWEKIEYAAKLKAQNWFLDKYNPQDLLLEAVESLNPDNVEILMKFNVKPDIMVDKDGKAIIDRAILKFLHEISLPIKGAWYNYQARLGYAMEDENYRNDDKVNSAMKIIQAMWPKVSQSYKENLFIKYPHIAIYQKNFGAINSK